MRYVGGVTRPKLARVIRVAEVATRSAPGTTRRTRRMAEISWVTVSWVATASSRSVESRARRVLPYKTPVASMTERTASKRLGMIRRAQTGAPIVRTE